MKKSRILPLILFPLLISACGGAIGDAQDFVPNKAPVFMRVSPLLWEGGSQYDSLTSEEKANLISNMTFLLDIEAADPENEGISYSYSSQQGTFTPQDDTASGTTAYFVTAEKLIAGEPVILTITATDPVGDSSEYSLELGTVKPVPTLNVSFSATAVEKSGTLNSGGSLNLYLSADCDGQYQMRIFTTKSSTAPKLDYDSFVWNYTDGETETVTISSTSEKCRITGAGKYYVWAIFTDAIGQEATACVTVTAE